MYLFIYLFFSLKIDNADTIDMEISKYRNTGLQSPSMKSVRTQKIIKYILVLIEQIGSYKCQIFIKVLRSHQTAFADLIKMYLQTLYTSTSHTYFV